MSSKNLLAIKKSLGTLSNTSKIIRTSVRSFSAWSQDRVIKSPFKRIEVPKCTVYDYVWQNLEKWPERTLSVCAVTGRGYTYEQVFQLSNTFAANLRKKFKIRDGDVITLMLPNVPDFPIASMAVLEAGGVLSTINPIYTPHEIQRQLKLSNSKLVITLPESVNALKEALKLAKMDIPIIAIKTNGDPLPEGTVCFNELSEDVNVDKSCLKEVRRGPDDVCFLPYSSGTTGLPKGVELTNRNIVANCEQINDCSIRAHNDTTPSHQDVMICVLPFYHIYGASVLMFHKMSQGVKLVTLAKFNPETYLQTLEKQKVNIVYLAPPLVLLMASHPSSSAKTFEHLETIVSGAAPLTATDVERFLRKAERTFDFRQGYGLTETSPVVCMTPRGVTAYDSVGPAIPSTELRVVDADLNPLGPNKTGELLIRGPQVMRGYRDNPQANAEALTKDGWFRSGDLAFVDESGHVTIADRLKELIKVKGLQVPPAELEGILRDHPAVSDAAVVGVPHPTDGESPRAFVVLKQGQKPETQGILDFVKYKVAPYKMIKEVFFVETIPKNATGKIMRKELRDKYC